MTFLDNFIKKKDTPQPRKNIPNLTIKAKFRLLNIDDETLKKRKEEMIKSLIHDGYVITTGSRTRVPLLIDPLDSNIIRFHENEMSRENIPIKISDKINAWLGGESPSSVAHFRKFRSIRDDIPFQITVRFMQVNEQTNVGKYNVDVEILVYPAIVLKLRQHIKGYEQIDTDNVPFLIEPSINKAKDIGATLKAIEIQEPVVFEEIAPQLKIEPNNRNIFIVHGHDSLLKQEVELFLKTLSLEPIILDQQASRNRTIIEKVEFYSHVSFAVILMTQDDIGAEAGISCHDTYSSYVRSIDSDYLEEMRQHVSEFLTKNELSIKDNTQTFVEIRDLYKILKMRARQNVLFECGFFIGKLGRENVAILCDNNVEIPTDLDGLCYLKIDAWDSWRKDLAMEINAAGIKIDEKKVSIYDKMRSYLIEDGFKSLNITTYLNESQIKDIVISNIKILYPDFTNDMKYMGLIGSDNEITNIGEIFLQRAFWKYYVKYNFPINSH